jgi:hypothetical protein
MDSGNYLKDISQKEEALYQKNIQIPEIQLKM